ncbi:MAG: hypothetical protein KGL39_13340 [Patescibacteria group bacterium]|nr:hypothetical protein [Patescibacteria group bacterium]
MTDNTQVIYFDGPVKITPQATWRAIPSSVFGEADDVLVDLTYKITGTPKSVWTAGVRGILLPDALLNFSAAGAPLIGAANRAVTVNGADANGFSFTRCILSKPPEVYFGLGAGLYSECEWTAFIGQGKALTDADAFYTLNTTAWSAADYPTTHQEQMCTAAWGAVTGFSTMFAEEGFKLTHELKLNPIKQGNVTVDQKVESYRGMIAFLPQQPTTAQLKAALAMDSAGGGLGSRRSANAADLVVAGTGISATLKGCAPRTGTFVFDNKLNRHGEFSFITALTAPGTRLVFS